MDLKIIKNEVEEYRGRGRHKQQEGTGKEEKEERKKKQKGLRLIFTNSINCK